MNKTAGGLVSAFIQGMNEHDNVWQALPQRLRGRGLWLQQRGRIKDCELMYDAATEIELLRKAVKEQA